MGESLTERRRVDDGGRKVVKSFSRGGNNRAREWARGDADRGISPGKLRASSRGNT